MIPPAPQVKTEEEDFIMVRVDSQAPSSTKPSTSTGASDFVLVQVEVDEAKQAKQLPRAKVEAKDDWDEDW